MSDTINIGGITVSKFYLGGSSDVKIYLGTTKLYPHLQEPCFAVVDNISTYTARTYVDVYETSSDKWYKLNNLSAYEEYGVYGSSTATTYYDGKLVIQDGYEYQYSGSGWNNIGEVSGSSRVPAGYSEVEYIENTGSSYINTTLQLCSATTNTFQVETKLIPNKIGTQTYQNIFSCMSEDGEPYQGFTYRYQSSVIQGQFIPSNDGSFTQVSNSDGTTSVTASSVNGLTYSHTYPLTICCGLDSSRSPFRYTNTKVYTFKVTLNNGIAADYVPTKRDNDSVYGLYDLITDTFYTSPNGNNFVGGSVVTGTTTYPMYYETKQDPPDNVTFSSMTEAEEYECPWVGMRATIAGDRYIFSGDSQSGYEWVYQAPRIPTAYTEVEYVENTGNSSVNLGVYLSSSVGNTFEITMTNTMSYTSGWGNYQTILTCMSEAGEPYGGFAYRFYVSESSIQCFLNPTTGQTFSSTTVDSKFEAIISCSGILNDYTHDYPLNLFSGLDSSKTPFRFCKGKVYSLQVTFNGVLTRDLVPCQRKSDSVYGLYDVVGDVFYTSVTSTPLNGGQPV